MAEQVEQGFPTGTDSSGRSMMDWLCACASSEIVRPRCGQRASWSSGQVPVPGVRPRSSNARHECFVMDASVLAKTAETAELDEQEH